MDFDALLAPLGSPAAALSLGAVLWAAAAWLGLATDVGGGADRLADRVRLAASALAVGAGQCAALLCVMDVLAENGGRPPVAPWFGAAFTLAAAVAALLLLGVAPGRARVLRGVAIVASAGGLLLASQLLRRALGAAALPDVALGALALGLLAGTATLAWAARRGAEGDVSGRALAGHVALVLLASAAPLGALLAAAPAIVPANASSGLPWITAIVVACVMAVAGAGVFAHGRGGRARPSTLARPAGARADEGAGVDRLTALPDRAGFSAWLQPAVEEATRNGNHVGLLVLGVNDFKKVNDAFGARGGDLALALLAARLRAAAGQVAAAAGCKAGPVARTGGDEFTLTLLGRVAREQAEQAARRLVEVVGAPLSIDGSSCTLTASVGVACAPVDGNVATVQAHAEAALRAAKNAGGAGYAVFESRIVDEARDRLDLLRDLRRAVEERQLELHYQPKIDARSAQVTAAEALLRWNHPTRGRIGPEVFIPLAERYGLIGAIGDWVIDDACRQARKWRLAGLKMRVAINLSPLQMRSEGLTDRLNAALQRYGIDPSRLTCEITETAAMEDTQATQRTFAQLGAAGLHVSIDDFGTGYSSLATLRTLPASELKIDRAFVRDLGSSENARAIVDAVVKMAHAIGLRVVAEGVETMQQRDILIGLGCDELQGYLFAKPMPARSLMLWALDDRRTQHAFRPSLFAETRTPTRFSAASPG